MAIAIKIIKIYHCTKGRIYLPKRDCFILLALEILLWQLNRWSFGGHSVVDSVVIRWSFNGHLVVIQLSFGGYLVVIWWSLVVIQWSFSGHSVVIGGQILISNCFRLRFCEHLVSFSIQFVAKPISFTVYYKLPKRQSHPVSRRKALG